MDLLTPRRHSSRRSPSKWNASPSKTEPLALTPQPVNVPRMRPWERKPVLSQDPSRKGKLIMKRPESRSLDDNPKENSRGEGCWVLSTPKKGARSEDDLGKRRLLGDLVGPIPAHWTRQSAKQLSLEPCASRDDPKEDKRTRKRKANGELVRKPNETSHGAIASPEKRTRKSPRKSAARTLIVMEDSVNIEPVARSPQKIRLLQPTSKKPKVESVDLIEDKDEEADAQSIAVATGSNTTVVEEEQTEVGRLTVENLSDDVVISQVAMTEEQSDVEAVSSAKAENTMEVNFKESLANYEALNTIHDEGMNPTGDSSPEEVYGETNPIYRSPSADAQEETVNQVLDPTSFDDCTKEATTSVTEHKPDERVSDVMQSLVNDTMMNDDAMGTCKSEEGEEVSSNENLVPQSPSSSLESSAVDLVDETLTIDVSRYLREDTLTVDVQASSSTSSPHSSNRKDLRVSSQRTAFEDDDDLDCSYGSDFFTDSILETSQLEDGEDDDASELGQVLSPGDSTITFSNSVTTIPLSPVRARLEADAQSSPFISRWTKGPQISPPKFNFPSGFQLDVSPSKVPLPPSPAPPRLVESSDEEEERHSTSVATSDFEDIKYTTLSEPSDGAAGHDCRTTPVIVQTTRKVPLHDDETSLLSFLDRVRNSKAVRLASTEASAFLRASLSPVRKVEVLKPLAQTAAVDYDLPTQPVDTSETTPTKSSRKRKIEFGPNDCSSLISEVESGPKSSQSSRRSKRNRTAPASSSNPPTYISVIPGGHVTRRGNGVDSYVPAKTVAQELAIVTRANTRRNRGNRELTAKVISTLLTPVNEDDLSIEEHQTTERHRMNLDGTTTIIRKPRKSVVWDEALVYFQTEEPVVQCPASPDVSDAINAQLATEILAASPSKPDEVQQDQLPAAEPENGTKARAKKTPKGRNGTRGAPARRRSSLSLAALADDITVALPSTPSLKPAPSSVLDSVMESPNRSPRRRIQPRGKALEPVLAPGITEMAVTKDAARATTRSRLPAPAASKVPAPEVVKRPVVGTPAKRRGRL